MAFGTFTLTGQLLLLDGVPAAGKVRVDGLPQVIIDSAGDQIKVGPYEGVLDVNGKFSVSLPSDSTTGNSASIAYSAVSELSGRGAQNVGPTQFYARPIGTTVDLADITPQVVVPLTPTGVSQADFDAYKASQVTGSTDPEVVRDTMAAALVGGANVTITPDDAANTITVAASTDPEVVRDTVAAALVAGTGITITANDVADTITIAATGAGTTTSARPVFLQVASADAPQAFKDGADYACDGVNDEVEINAAIDRASALQSRNSLMPVAAQQIGKVVLSGGRFNIGGTGIKHRTGVTLEGSGFLTQVRAVSLGANPVIGLADGNAHLTKLGHMWLDGNSTGGGTGHAVDYDMSTSANTSDYPDINQDSNHFIYDLYVDNFAQAGSTRHGIYMHSSTTTNNRVNFIDRCTLRDLSGNGVYMNAASDSFINMVHAGGVIGGSGFYINTGNTRIGAGCKAAYCNVYGFYLASGRGTIAGAEAQDCATGFMFDGAPWNATGITSDTSSADGIVVSTDRLVLNGFSIFCRTGGRYTTQTNGLRFDVNTYADCIITGQIDDPLITNKIVGTPGARSFMRATNGAALVAVG